MQHKRNEWKTNKFHNKRTMKEKKATKKKRNFREHYWNYVQDVKDKNDQATLAAYFAIRAMKCKLGFEEVDPDLIGFNKYAIIHNNTPMVDVATYNDEENQWEHIKTVPIV